MASSFDFKDKWNIDKAIKKVERAVNHYNGLDKYEALDGWHSLKAYMATLEIELKSYYRKAKDGICI